MLLFAFVAASLAELPPLFQSLADEARRKAKAPKLASAGEAALHRGHHSRGAIRFELAYDLFDESSPEVLGLARDSEYVAVIPNRARSGANEMFSSGAVLSNAADKELLQLKRSVASDGEVTIYRTKPLDFYQVFKSIEMGTFMANEDVFVAKNRTGPLILTNSEEVEEKAGNWQGNCGSINPARKKKGEWIGECVGEYSWNWNAETNRPTKTEVADGLTAQFGFYARLTTTVHVQMKLFRKLKAKLTASLDAAGGIGFDVEETVSKDKIVITQAVAHLFGTGKVFEQVLSIFGWNLGFSLDIIGRGVLRNPSITLDQKFSYYRGLNFESGLTAKIGSSYPRYHHFEAKKPKLTPTKEGDLPTITEFLSSINTVSVTPTVELELKLTVNLGKDEDQEVEEYIGVRAGVEMNFRKNKVRCPSSHWHGDRMIKFDWYYRLDPVEFVDVLLHSIFGRFWAKAKERLTTWTDGYLENLEDGKKGKWTTKWVQGLAEALNHIPNEEQERSIWHGNSEETCLFIGSEKSSATYLSDGEGSTPSNDVFDFALDKDNKPLPVSCYYGYRDDDNEFVEQLISMDADKEGGKLRIVTDFDASLLDKAINAASGEHFYNSQKASQLPQIVAILELERAIPQIQYEDVGQGDTYLIELTPGESLGVLGPEYGAELTNKLTLTIPFMRTTKEVDDIGVKFKQLITISKEMNGHCKNGYPIDMIYAREATDMRNTIPAGCLELDNNGINWMTSDRTFNEGNDKVSEFVTKSDIVEGYNLFTWYRKLNNGSPSEVRIGSVTPRETSAAVGTSTDEEMLDLTRILGLGKRDASSESYLYALECEQCSEMRVISNGEVYYLEKGQDEKFWWDTANGLALEVQPICSDTSAKNCLIIDDRMDDEYAYYLADYRKGAYYVSGYASGVDSGSPGVIDMTEDLGDALPMEESTDTQILRGGTRMYIKSWEGNIKYTKLSEGTLTISITPGEGAEAGTTVFTAYLGDKLIPFSLDDDESTFMLLGYNPELDDMDDNISFGYLPDGRIVMDSDGIRFSNQEESEALLESVCDLRVDDDEMMTLVDLPGSMVTGMEIAWEGAGAYRHVCPKRGLSVGGIIGIVLGGIGAIGGGIALLWKKLTKGVTVSSYSGNDSDGGEETPQA